MFSHVHRSSGKICAILAVALKLALVGPLVAAAGGPQEGNTMTTEAAGAFDVKVAPVENVDHDDGNSLGRYSLDKHYHGDLEARGLGEMLTAGTTVETSGSYVAIERVEGTLHGENGSFVLRHAGSMSDGSQELDIQVVPDSGAGGLAGIEGRLEIEITAEGGHLYRLIYTLSGNP